MDIFNKKKVYIGYMTAGTQPIDYQIEAALALERGGVDLLEIGFPYSDPVADGPVIQEAMQLALKRKTKAKDVLQVIREIRKRSKIPMVLFSYCNPLVQLGDTFLEDLHKAGVEGVLMLDLPFEEKLSLRSPLKRISVATPATSSERVSMLSDKGDGFLYYACRKGTTGVRKGMPEGFEADMQRIKKHSRLPVVAGFGIGSKESAQEALAHADGFVVGSLFVKAMNEDISSAELQSLATSLDPR